MDLIERELLEAIACDRDDEAALGVLADYWMGHGEEARGELLALSCGERGDRIDLADEEVRLSVHVDMWRAQLAAAGFAESDLVLDRGILQWPLVVKTGEPLDDDPALLRLSPRYYREAPRAIQEDEYLVYAADVVTPMRAVFPVEARVVVKSVRDPNDRDAKMFLEREHRNLTRLSHPNIQQLVGLAVRRTGLALVTRWAGVAVGTIVREATRHGQILGAGFAISVAVQLCEALAAIHRAGIVHREIRPDHVLVRADGTVTVIDFGLVQTGEQLPRERYRSPGPRLRGLPAFGYISPEQALGRELDARSDLFSAMLVTCLLVSGQHPVRERANDMDLLLAIRDCRFVLPPLPAAIALVVRRVLVREPTLRVATADELREMLVAAATAAGLDIGPHVIARSLVELGVPA